MHDTHGDRLCESRQAPGQRRLAAGRRGAEQRRESRHLVGAGALGATDEVIAVAERLQAGCAKALLGKAVLPDDLPWVTGSLGLLGTNRAGI